jgi:hypothetical protein
MNARNKLNVAYVNGSLFFAGIIGLLTQSWVIFGVALVALLIVNLCSGDIRPKRKKVSVL